MPPIRYADTVETIADDEDETAAALIAAMKSISATTFADEHKAIRAVHAKSHALLNGELTVIDGLAPELAQGLFAAPGSTRRRCAFRPRRATSSTTASARRAAWGSRYRRRRRAARRRSDDAIRIRDGRRAGVRRRRPRPRRSSEPQIARGDDRQGGRAEAWPCRRPSCAGSKAPSKRSAVSRAG